MRKKWMIHRCGVLAFVISAASASLYGQNIQLHYDFGRNFYSDAEPDRQKVTATLEQFSADRLGSWFYFVDIDFSRKFTVGAYAEISREFNLWRNAPLAAHVEYNGGLNRFGSFQQAALVGAAWNGHSGDFSKTWGVQLMYKRYFKSYDTTRAYNSVQLTGVWNATFARCFCTASGYIDFWRGEQANGHGKLIICAEPQFWWNLAPFWRHDAIPISIGTELEVSNNFVFNTYDDRTFFINPTLALKWTFK